MYKVDRLTNHSPLERRHLYASGPIEDVLPLEHRSYVGPLDFLTNVSLNQVSSSTSPSFSSSLSSYSSSSYQVQFDVWFSGDNVTAETHYDTLNNFYMVTYGKKTFQLASPRAHNRLSLYPSLHAAYRQVQVHPLMLTTEILSKHQCCF